MIGVLTGDIINSRKVPPQRWLPVLKKTLSFHGKHPSAWEIFRGDSFQIQTDAEQALLVACTSRQPSRRSGNWMCESE